MKKTIITSCLGMIITAGTYAQPVSDRAVVPIGVTLNEILRIKINNGGNIEFVFNNISQYRDGINGIAQGPLASTDFYTTDVEISSSGQWKLDMGAEDANFVDVDDVANILFSLDNVGFTLEWGVAGIAGNTCCGPIGFDVDNTGAYTNAVTALGVQNIANGLLQYMGEGTCTLLTSGDGGNGGDGVNDNFFSLFWECGTAGLSGVGTSPMNVTALLDQTGLPPHRYVTNVFFELSTAP